MAGRVEFYTGPALLGQCGRALLVFTTLSVGLAACASIGSVADVTGSIPAPAPAAAQAPAAPAASAETRPADSASDWEAVKRSVARVPPAGDTRAREAPRVEWSNAETGNSGTISEVIASSRKGAACKGFATTLSSVDGVRLYRGEMCRAGRGWELVTVEPADKGRL